MPNPDPYPKVRRLVVKLLKEGLAPFGFSQFEKTCYFFRDRGCLRDALFFQKMRSSYLTIAYGLSEVPVEEKWSPGLRCARWLKDQEWYNVKYEEHALDSIPRAIAALETEAIPYFAQFSSPEDFQKYTDFG